MPKKEIETPYYIDITAIPTSKRGQKQIPEEWVTMITAIPKRKALIISDLKYTTIQGRIRKLAESNRLIGNYKVIQRKVNDKPIVYVAHEE